MKNLFMSYYSEDEADAEDIATHLENVFGNVDFAVFKASRPESVRPGDAWQDKIIDTLAESDALLVLMTVNALGRPWVNFEIGVTWARKARILMFCDRGMTPAALPTPYNTLQAVDLNNMSHEAKLNKVAETVGTALDIRPSETAGSVGSLSSPSSSIDATVRSWAIRPSGHIGATTTGEFLVGAIAPVRGDRANAAGFQPGEAIFVRLFLGTTPEGRYINAMVGGEAASLFDTITRDTVVVRASIKLAAAFQDGDNVIPLIVIETAEVIR